MAPPRRRRTRQRVAITEVLKSTEDFVSAQQVHHMLRASGDTTGLATVYRTLGTMSADGTVDVIRNDDGELLYRRCDSTEHHHHLVCRECGFTVEVEGPGVEKWADTIATTHGFADVSHMLELFGVCAACASPGTGADKNTGTADS